MKEEEMTDNMTKRLPCANPTCKIDMTERMKSDDWFVGMYGIPACSRRCARKSMTTKKGSVWIGG